MELFGLVIHPLTLPVSDQIMIIVKISGCWVVASSVHILTEARDIFDVINSL